MFKVYYNEYEVGRFNTIEECNEYINSTLEEDDTMERRNFNVYEVVNNTYGDNYEDSYEEEIDYDDEEDEEEDYEDEEDDREPLHYEQVGISVEDTMTGIMVSVIGDTNILQTYQIDLDMNKYSKMEIYNLTKEVARAITMYYHTHDTVLPTLEEVKDLLRKEIIK